MIPSIWLQDIIDESFRIEMTNDVAEHVALTIFVFAINSSVYIEGKQSILSASNMTLNWLAFGTRKFKLKLQIFYK